MKKYIFTGFAPNLSKQDVVKAIGFLFLPWKWFFWKKGPDVAKVEDWLKQYFTVLDAVTFDSGRTALYYALKALGVGKGDEVVLQAYTCIVVTNAIRWTGAKPVYVDVMDDFNMSAKSFEDVITSKTKAVIIQHTFGTSADLEQLLPIAKKNNLKIIEDCAHSFGADYNGKKLGTFSDIGILSFGSDKVVSCARGGGLVVNNAEVAKKLRKLQHDLPFASLFKIKQHLLSFPFFYFGKETYHIGVGKGLLWVAKKLHLTNRIIYNKEKRGQQVSFYPTKLPNALASILLGQLSNLASNLEHRKKIASIYSSTITNNLLPITNSIFLRYPLLVDNPNKLLQIAKKNNIILGDWYRSVVAPADIDPKITGYVDGCCSNAEKLAKKSVNLPTNASITPKQAIKISKIVNAYGN
jgi:perosamine synthetase